MGDSPCPLCPSDGVFGNNPQACVIHWGNMQIRHKKKLSGALGYYFSSGAVIFVRMDPEAQQTVQRANQTCGIIRRGTLATK